MSVAHNYISEAVVHAHELNFDTVSTQLADRSYIFQLDIFLFVLNTSLIHITKYQ